jgi:hypothetical protein
MMGGPAFASNNPVVGNVTGNGNIGIASGNNVQIPVQIPVDICGNAAAFLGFADAGCRGGAAALLDSGNSTTTNNNAAPEATDDDDPFGV